MMDNYGQLIQRSLGSILRVALAVLMCLTLNTTFSTGFQAAAQNRSASKTVKIKGSVIDEDSKPVPGVAVLVKGRPELGGTMTDENGEFAFNVPCRKNQLLLKAPSWSATACSARKALSEPSPRSRPRIWRKREPRTLPTLWLVRSPVSLYIPRTALQARVTPH